MENLKLEAAFDDFKVITDQPIRYKGDGTAPGPFDYFLASSALCAAYFVKVYCKARDINTNDIFVSQDNIVDPENRYKQTFKITLEIPEYISAKDREGMIASIDRCSVKRTIQNAPEFVIEAKTTLAKEANNVFDQFLTSEKSTEILGKDAPLEVTIKNMVQLLDELGIKIEISSWRNPVPNVWSVHIRDADSPMCFTNGKGASKEAALASALGEYLERISCNYFYADFYLGQEITGSDFVHYPNEKWFPIVDVDHFPTGLMDENLWNHYQLDGELKPNHLIDTNSGLSAKGICTLPFIRQSDQTEVFIPVNIIGNLFVSNGMSAGNSMFEARVQCLSEIFERAIKNKIITDEIVLPDVPEEILDLYPGIQAGLKELRKKGFPLFIKDASLGGKFPVMNVTLMNPKTGGVFASFGAHPNFEVALERSLTELLQGRSFEGLNDVPPPTFNEFALKEHNNIIDHFIDSTGVISWRFFKSQPDYSFEHWNFSGSTEEEFQLLMDIFKRLEKEVYIADYQDLGAHACRILVPGFSEIYEVEDLIWDNNNRALEYREPILNLHTLTNEQLEALVVKLEESEIDNYMPISELIGIAFDENDEWGQLVIGELKAMIYLALKNYPAAKEYVENINTFHDGTLDRKKYYQLMNILLDIVIQEDGDFATYTDALNQMYGEKLVDDALACILGEKKFLGLVETDMSLKNLEKHQRLIESYKKLQNKRARL